MELIVIRHGQSYVNLGNWDNLDTMDTALTDLGHQQAGALRDWLIENDKSADVLYVSTMKRTRETGDYVAEALKLKPIYDDRIREVGNSYLDGQPIDEADLPRSFLRNRATQFTPIVTDVDNAESWMHFRIRVGQFVEGLIEKHRKKTVYVVAHGGVIMAIFENLFGVGMHRNSCDLHTYNTGWVRFKYRGSKFADWTLYEYNRVDHLIKADLF